MDFKNLIITAIAVLICISVHEWGHAFMAYILGDKTAKDDGRLTINPFAHLDPVGFLALMFLGFGWAKPVPVRTNNFKHYKRDLTLVALAGPLINILLSIFAFTLAIILIVVNSTLSIATASFLGIIGNLSIGLAIFNLLPIPPLDGSKIFIQFFPQKIRFWIEKNQQFIQFFLILGLITNLFNTPLYYLISHARNGIFQIVTWLTFFL